jgi:hypothetical protein
MSKQYQVKVSKQALTYIVQYLTTVVKNVAPYRNTLLKVVAKQTDNGEAWSLIATDGHRIVTNMVDASEIVHNFGVVECDIQFPASFVDHYKLKLKEAKSQDDDYTIDLGDMASRCLKDDEFPVVEYYLRPNPAYEYSVSFNAEYLEEMLRAMRADKRRTQVTLRFKDSTSPIRVTCGGSSFGVLMPVRDGCAWGVSKDSEKDGAA